MLTFKTRLKAIFIYGYRPGWKEFLIHWVQSAIVFTMPNSLLYTLYQFWKNNLKLSFSLPGIYFQKIFKNFIITS